MQEKEFQKTSKYNSLYFPADKYIIYNDNDPELRPITIRLPDPPDVRCIEGYGLPPEQQKFRHAETPPRLKEVERSALLKAKEKHDGRMIGYMQQMYFWDALNENQESYQDEINFIKREHWRLRYGHWVWIFGKPYWIPPKHYFYLNYYYPTAVEGSKIDFRNEDREVKIYEEYCDTTTETFKYRDDNGFAVKNENDGYDLVDVGHRVCMGDAHPKRRRKGITMQNCSDGVYILITGKEKHVVIQANIGKAAEDIYRDHILPAWKNLPIWIKPVYDGNNDPAEGLFLKPPSSVIGEKYLDSWLVWNESAKEGVNDRRKLHYLLSDEEGKCFGAGTMIKMYDGSNKAIEDVVIGDIVASVSGGWDSVVSINNGVSKLYKIIPKKSKPWVCDENHVLHCSVSDKHHEKYYQGKSVCDIVLRDYLTFPSWRKRSLALYKKGTDWPEQNVNIPPYFLGVWLGDGSKASLSVTNVDEEIIDYMREMCVEYNMSMLVEPKRKITYRIKTYSNDRPVKYYHNGVFVRDFSSARVAAQYFKRSTGFISWNSVDNKREHYFEMAERPNNFLYDFKELGVVNNKHIPNVYLRNSKDVRLRVLAGIVDTDGYVMPGKREIEIASIYPRLADDIVELAKSLGFSVTDSDIQTSMRRKDGSIYHGSARRIKIRGSNISGIPCLVKRKKDALCADIRKNRDAIKEGFSVEYVGVGNYYGITLRDNPLFLLSDYTVVHNCELNDVAKRWAIDRLTLIQGTSVHGISRHPSTVEEMNSGGEFFMKMFMDSNFYRRDLVGMTGSGLFSLFRPVWMGWDNFIDEWGFSVTGTPTEAQLKNPPLKSEYHVLGMGSKEFWERKYDEMLSDPTKHADYRVEIRKHPMVSGDCWRGGSSDMGWDYLILDKALSDLRGRNDVTVRGNFIRRGDVVDFVQSDEGRFVVANLFLGQQNQFLQGDQVWNPDTGLFVSAKRPKYPSKFSIGADPFDYRSSGSKAEFHLSDGGIGVYHNSDPNEAEKPITEQESGQIVCYYEARPSLDVYCQDLLAVSIWFGGLVNLESNLKMVIKYFYDTGFGGYLWRATMPDGTFKKEPGTYSGAATKNEMLNALRDFVAYRAHKCKIKEFLNSAREIRDPKDLTYYDGLAACGWAIYAANSGYGKTIERFDDFDFDFDSLYGTAKRY